jgi:hypothetical protein
MEDILVSSYLLKDKVNCYITPLGKRDRGLPWLSLNKIRRQRIDTS